jgi:hypothetical protein
MKMKGSLSARKTISTTGRSGYHLVNDRPTAAPRVASFVHNLCSTDCIQNWGFLLLTNGIAKSIKREVKQAVSIGIQGPYFRGRRFPQGQEPQSVADFGPPEKQDKGRYNEHGKRVLYLCRDQRIVVAECIYTSEKPCLYVQAFDIQLPLARILKLDADLEKDFPNLHYFLLESEYSAEGTNFVKLPYRATHFLAEVCHRLDIDAVEYPSIRGGYKDNRDAVNLVIFERHISSICNMAVGRPFKCG